jgi:hypothetical protein
VDRSPPNIEGGDVSINKQGRLSSRPFYFRAIPKNYFRRPEEPVTQIGYYCSRRLVGKIMRILASVLVLSAMALPCAAQTVLKSEPLVLAPYEIAFVQDTSCGAGKVLKVTGAIRGLHRKRLCVALAAEQASLATATP